MKVYTLLYFSHWDYDNEVNILGVYTTINKAKKAMKEYIENNIETNNNSNYNPDTDFYWNKDETYFSAYEETNYDEEWLQIIEKEVI